MNRHDRRDEPLAPPLARAGGAVADLPREDPPADLVKRTLARIAEQCQPVKEVFWLLRPIFSPAARVAAAAAIILVMLPMADVDVAAPLGAKIERGIIGPAAAERIEHVLDSILVRNGPPQYSEYELNALMGIQRPRFEPPPARRTPERSSPQGRV
jgi:hypothetical protein